MHLDIKKMKYLSTKALDDGLQFFIDLVSGEERKALFRTFSFTCPGNVKTFLVWFSDKIKLCVYFLSRSVGGSCAKIY